jgi:hypothetical protein
LLFAFALVLALVGSTGASGETGPAAPSGTANRAVIVIDDGTQRTATCVTFSEPSISGLEALKRSGAVVVDQAFGSMGGAVCSINGIGCPLTGCLTCKAPAYWNYFRSVGGTGFARSGAGASTAKVRDGDVEGWAWGANPAAPPLPSVDDVCGPRPSPPAPPVAPPSPVAPSPAAAAPATPGASGSSGAVPGDAGAGPSGGQAEATPTTDGDATTTTAADATAPDARGDDDGDGSSDLEILEAEELAALGARAEPDEGSGGPPWWSMIGFAAIVAGLGAWLLVVRRQRNATP